MKHTGKMKNNSARVVVVYRTLPGDPHSCLVVGVQGLGDSYHDTLMSLVETDAAQQANELADILAARRFPDGTVMLGYLHANGHLKKVPTSSVLMTPNPQTAIPLDELNQIIAKQKGIALEELSVSEENAKNIKKTQTSQTEVVEEKVSEVKTDPKSTTPGFELTPAEMRSRADTLYKEAARLRKEADVLDPPKAKPVKAKATAE